MYGSYRIESLIGLGGMGGVYRAVDTRLDRKVAIKVSRTSFSDRFEREARTLSSLNHPHICTLFDVGPNYLVMELLEGTTLAARIAQGPLPIEEIARHGAEIAEALAEAHRAGVIHRDLKPQNIMVTRHGVKVLDFGIARVVDESLITATGAVVGTPAYMAPEQRRGDTVDARSDLYALGLILHEMATGRRPEPGVQRSRLRADVNPLVDALLDPDPAKRPQSAAETAERLRQLTAGGHHESRRLRPRTLVGIGAVAAIAVVVVAAWWWAQRSNQSRVLDVLSVAPIAVSPGAKFDPALSPDCRSIAFGWAGARGDSPGLYVAPATGGEPQRLTHSAPPDLGRKAPLDLDPKWSPNGRRIAFLRVPAGGLSYELRVIGANGEDERKVRDVLLPPSFDVSLEWMADGRSVLIPMLDPETRFVSLFRVEVDDPGVTARPFLAGGFFNHPALSPNGRWLAYLEKHTLRVHQLGPDGMPTGEPRDVVEGVELRSFHWSSDDRTLLFMNGTTNRVSSWDSETNAVDLVYASPVRIQAMAATWEESCGPRAMLTIAGGQVELRSLALLADGAKAAGPSQLIAQGTVSPAFSPDGRWIAFGRSFEGAWDLWLMDASGQRMRRLTAFNAVGLREPSWSPNGQQIAFHARRKSIAEVFVLDIDPEAVMARAVDAPPSVEPRRVVEVPFDLVAAQWSRDGKYLYVLRNVAGRLLRVPAAGGELEDLFESDAARMHPTEDRIYYNKRGGEPPGIFSRSLVGNPRANREHQVLTDTVAPSGWTVTERGIYYFARVKLGTPDVMRYFDFKKRRLSDLGPTTLLGFSTLRASPDGSRLIYDTTLESDGSMLALQLRARSR